MTWERKQRQRLDAADDLVLLHAAMALLNTARVRLGDILRRDRPPFGVGPIIVIWGWIVLDRIGGWSVDRQPSTIEAFTSGRAPPTSIPILGHHHVLENGPVTGPMSLRSPSRCRPDAITWIAARLSHSRRAMASKSRK